MPIIFSQESRKSKTIRRKTLKIAPTIHITPSPLHTVKHITQEIHTPHTTSTLPEGKELDKTKQRKENRIERIVIHSIKQD